MALHDQSDVPAQYNLQVVEVLPAQPMVHVACCKDTIPDIAIVNF